MSFDYQFLLIIVSLFFLRPIIIGNAELFTAHVHLESLLNTEEEFYEFTENYLNDEYERLEKIKKSLDILKQGQLVTKENIKSFFDNPINIYHLTKRLKNEVQPIQELMKSTHYEELIRHFKKKSKELIMPNDDDLIGVVIGIYRLNNFYNLNVSNIAKGFIYEGINVSKHLTALDCYNIGLILYNNKIFNGSIAWFEEARNKEISIYPKSVHQENLYLSLSTAYTMMGNLSTAVDILKEYIKYDPNNEKVRKTYSELSRVLKYAITAIPIATDRSREISQQNPEWIWNSFQKLCTGQQLLPLRVSLKLKCYYFKNKSPYLILQPAKMEDVRHGPLVSIIHDLIKESEIELIKRLSLKLFERSSVVHDDGSYTVLDSRISKSSWLSDYYHPTISKISLRIQEITGLDVMNSAEALQIVNYGIGGHYDLHLDHSEEGQEITNLEKRLGNRLATVLIYLSNVKVGGITAFPALGIGVSPEKGSAVFWYNLLLNGSGNSYAMHASCPVISGSKWVANKWIHMYKQEFRRPCALKNEFMYDLSPLQHSKSHPDELPTVSMK